MDEQQNMNQGASQPKEGSVGPVIGTIIILAVIVLGGLYFWGQRADDTVPADADTEEVMEGEAMMEDDSDVEAMEADLEATDIDGLDAELDAQ